ncbi:MAG: ATP-binding protein [Candidatus Woesearchaeota archaeon]|jgi:signal transduction histidine kinase
MQEDLDTLLMGVAAELERQIRPHLTRLRSDLDIYRKSQNPAFLILAQTDAQAIETILNQQRDSKNLMSDLDDATRSLRHDIRQPLHGVIGYLSLIESQTDPTKMLNEVCHYMTKIEMWLHMDQQSGISLSDIITSVHHFVDNSMIRMIFKDKDREVYTVPSFTIRRIYQAVHNAKKAKKENVALEITLSCYIEGIYGVITIEDNGIGINPETIAATACAAGYSVQLTYYDTIRQILLPGVSGFKQMGRVGNGTGLTSTRLAAEKGGESVDLETTIEETGGLLTIDKQHPQGAYGLKPHTGTTFKFYFPLAQTVTL